MAATGTCDEQVKLYVMVSGLLHYDQSVFTYDRGTGTEVEVPSLVFLVVHPEGLVLFDTGLDPQVAKNAENYWGDVAGRLRPIMDENDGIDSQLARLGYLPKDVRYIVLSCLFRDHTGGLKYFPDTTMVVQQRELQEARSPSPSTHATYDQPYHHPDIWGWEEQNYLPLDDRDWDMFDDNTVCILSVPCHAKGEQALVVRLPKTGTIVLPAGVIPTRQNLENNVMTGRLMVAPEKAHRSVLRLKRIIRDEEALVLYHHDPEDWKSYRLSPDYYR